MIAPATPELWRVGVIGCGVMGSGVAEVCALAGLDVLVVVSSAASETVGRRRLQASLDRGVRKGRLDETAASAALEQVRFTTDLADAGDRQLVVEAVAEDELTKVRIFQRLDQILGEDAILATNTSAIPIMRLAAATRRSGSVIGLHFFNPVQTLPLVELVGCLQTDEKTFARAAAFVTDVLGKEPIRVGDRAGFVVNALLIPYLLAAVRMVEGGYADAEVVDRGMELGCAHPAGPLKLVDLIGADTVIAIAESLFAEFREPLYAPPPLLVRMAEAGLLGRKSGQGFYQYS